MNRSNDWYQEDEPQHPNFDTCDSCGKRVHWIDLIDVGGGAAYCLECYEERINE